MDAKDTSNKENKRKKWINTKNIYKSAAHFLDHNFFTKREIQRFLESQRVITREIVTQEPPQMNIIHTQINQNRKNDCNI